MSIGSGVPMYFGSCPSFRNCSSSSLFPAVYFTGTPVFSETSRMISYPSRSSSGPVTSARLVLLIMPVIFSRE